MDSLILKLIDRHKRIRNLLITYFVLLPIGIFSIGCFYIPRYSSTQETIFEKEFGFETYWRFIGSFMLLAVGMTYIFLSKLLPFKKGSLHLTKEKISIKNGKQIRDFPIALLKDFEFKADVPFDTDDREDFKKASVLKFKINNKKFEFEVCTETKEALAALTPIVKAWQESNPAFQYGYK